MNSDTITMRALDGMGFRKANCNPNAMILELEECFIYVVFKNNIYDFTFSAGDNDKLIEFMCFPHIKTIDDIKLLYRVLTGEDWKG